MLIMQCKLAYLCKFTFQLQKYVDFVGSTTIATKLMNIPVAFFVISDCYRC